MGRPLVSPFRRLLVLCLRYGIALPKIRGLKPLLQVLIRELAALRLVNRLLRVLKRIFGIDIEIFWRLNFGMVK